MSKENKKIAVHQEIELGTPELYIQRYFFTKKKKNL